MKNSLQKIAFILLAITMLSANSKIYAQTTSAARFLQQIACKYDSTTSKFTVVLQWQDGLIDDEHPIADFFNIYRAVIGHNTSVDDYEFIGSTTSENLLNGKYNYEDIVPNQGAYSYYVKGVSNNISGEISPLIQAFAPTNYCVNLNALIIDFKSFPLTIAYPGILYQYQSFAAHRSPRVQGWVRYAIVESPENMTIDNLSGLLKWAPPNNANGEYYVKIRATSDEDSRAESIQEWIIRIANNDEQSTVLGIDEESNSFNIYPTIASDYIKIQSVIPAKAGICFEIFNIFGEKIPTRQASSATPHTSTSSATEGNLRIDISNLPAGVYFIKIGDRFEKIVKI